MFDIFVDWPKKANFILYYRTLEFVDPVPFLRINRKIKYSKPKLQKNVPANNCHHKVIYKYVSVMPILLFGSKTLIKLLMIALLIVS